MNLSARYEIFIYGNHAIGKQRWQKTQHKERKLYMSISVKKVNDTIVSKSILPTKQSVEEKLAEQTLDEAKQDILELNRCMYNEYFTDEKLLERVRSNKILRDNISMQDMARPDVMRAKIASLSAEQEYDQLRRTAPAMSRAEQDAFNKALYQDCNAEVFNLASVKYHIAYEPKNGGRVFIRRPQDKTFLVLMKKVDCPFGGNPNVVGAVSNSGLTDLSAKEFADIKNTKPTIETLLNAYVLCFQDNITLTNIDKPTIVL